jgi:hypothetical protein
MNNVVMINRETVPCWYDVSFDSENVALIVKIHEDFLPQMRVVSQDSTIPRLMKGYGFTNFCSDFSAEIFGFDGSLKNLGSENHFLKLSAHIPELEIFRMQVCLWCQGHKKDMLFGGTCQNCRGKGIEKVTKVCLRCNGQTGEGIFFPMEDCYACKGRGKVFDSTFDWKPFHAICATLRVLFGVLCFGIEKDKLTLCPLPQLLTIESYIDKEWPSAPLGGTYSRVLVEWLATLVSSNSQAWVNLMPLQDAMERTWRKAQGHFNDLDRMQIWAMVRKNGWFSINCPGDRTGLIMENNRYSHIEGSRFYDHNLDTCIQQLTLLSGLGALCDLARKAI